MDSNHKPPVGSIASEPSLAVTALELRQCFERNGYVRWQNASRLHRDGYLGYRKGDEVRLTACDREELELLRALLGDAGFQYGRPFAKGRQFRLPIYGRKAVIRFLKFIGIRPKHARTARGRIAEGGKSASRTLRRASSARG